MLEPMLAPAVNADVPTFQQDLLDVVGELGREIRMSLMPEPGALPVRGAYFSEGDFLATPVVAGKVDAPVGSLTLQAGTRGLHLQGS